MSWISFVRYLSLNLERFDVVGGGGGGGEGGGGGGGGGGEEGFGERVGGLWGGSGRLFSLKV